MSEATQRPWGFYLEDMIGFAEKVRTYTANLDQAGFVASETMMQPCATWSLLVRPRPIFRALCAMPTRRSRGG